MVLNLIKWSNMEKPSFKQGPRIYNLFPRIIGPIYKWSSHLSRINDMKFNWIYLNPITETGFSGSLYAIKDHFKINPMLDGNNGDDEDGSWAEFRDFVDKAHDMEIKIMYDLVINHTAVDSDLVARHSDWYLKKWALVDRETDYSVKFYPLTEPLEEIEYDVDKYKIEKRIASPFAIDPADATKITVWGDLAEIDNKNSPDIENLRDYWKKVIKFYLDLGIDGFRCDAAYKVPPEMWRSLIDYGYEQKNKVLWMAETLGCTLSEMEETVKAGFDYINNSSKWWDYTAPWCMKQYNEFRKYAPSVGFPESHDTKRLAKETGGRLDVQIFKYLFAAFFSAGVLMPIGYEFGFKKRINVVKMTSADLEEKHFNISEEISEINLFKSAIKCLNSDGPMKHYSDYSDSNILIMRKTSEQEDQHLLLIYNKDWNSAHDVHIKDLEELMDLGRTVYRININRDATIYNNEYFEKKLEPNEYVFLLQE